jgi:Putative zinc-finger
MDERPDCGEIRALLPELAAGIASGDERARALRHLSECVDCRRELDALSTVVDELVTLAPPVEPPAGFESAVLVKIAPARRRWWQHRALRLAVTAVLAIAVGVGVTWQATAEDRRVAEAYRETLRIAGGRFLTARPITEPDGTRAGRVFAYQGTPSWLFVVIQSYPFDGPYRVNMVTKDGRDAFIGEMEVVGGDGSWGVAIDVDVVQIAEVRLSGGPGPPLTAGFR